MNNNAENINSHRNSNSLTSDNKTKTNSNNQTIIKKEKQDDQEINELAAKLIEANKAKMALTLQKNQQPANAGKVPPLNILNLLSVNDKTNSSAVIIDASDTSLSNSKDIDEDSLKGRFGWTTMGSIDIPYIIRSGEKYCSVRMVESKGLNKWLNYLHPDLYNCTNVRSFYVTPAEARLFNEINQKHCDNQFGREFFTLKDLIVKLPDAKEFYDFLGYCYQKLVGNVNSKTNSGDTRCGFVRINKESVVPFTIVNNEKYVPLFYFEGETDNLKRRANKLEGWDLSYLKFCCKVQGIRNELFAHDSCSVISVNDIKNYFPPGTVFEDYWPKKNSESSTQQLLVTDTRPANFTTRNNGVHWTRQPLVSPQSSEVIATTTGQSLHTPTPNTRVQAKAMVNGPSLNNVQLYNTYEQPSYTATQQQQQAKILNSTAARPGPYVSQTNSRFIRPGVTYYNNHGINNNDTGSGINGPPPLVRPTSNNFGIYYPTNHVMNQSSANVSTVLTEGVRYSNSSSNNSRTIIHKTKSSHSANNEKALNSPYRLQKINIQEKIVDAINMKPNVFSDYLVLLQDLITNFFNGVSIEDCKKVLKVLAIDVYNANVGQMQVLLENRRCSNKNETVPLVHVKSIVNFMPQLKYMLCVITC